MMMEPGAPSRIDAGVAPLKDWRAGSPTPGDRALAVLVALGLPVAAAWLLAQTGGALASLALYYGVVSVALPLWRRGSLGYHRPVRWPWLLLLASLAIPVAQAWLGLEGGWPGWPLGPGPWLTVLLPWLPTDHGAEWT